MFLFGGGSVGGKGSGPVFPSGFGGSAEENSSAEGSEGEGDTSEEVDSGKLYATLGVDKDASQADIKKAYREMAKRHHPDKGGDPEVFKDIQKAFEVLGDPHRRSTYDRHGQDGVDGDDNHQGDPHDLLAQLFGGQGGKGKGRGQRPRTKDIERPLWVTLNEIYTGTTRTLSVTRRVLDEAGDGIEERPCPSCDGQGCIIQVVRMGPIVQQLPQSCPRCGGAGKLVKTKAVKEELEVFVEKGSPDGHRILFRNKADECAGHEPGDVVVVVRQQEHPVFLRRGADLFVERELSLAEALTGMRLVVEHLDDRRLIVRGKPGEVLQPQKSGILLKGVRGSGMPIHGDPFRFGNLFISISIRFPDSVDPAAATELRRLLGGPSFDNEEGSQEEGDEDAEAEEIDPLESSKQSGAKAGGQAYDEDEHPSGPDGQAVQCRQQ